MVTFTIGLSGWQCWASGISADVPWRKWIAGEVQPVPGDAPALKDVKPVHRRRLSPIGRAAYFCATQCVADAKPVATVFCSAHGEGSRTLELLEAIAKGEALSPNSFSLSVHNSVAGLFSIFNHETAPSVTLAAGLDGLGAAFAEGQGLLQEHRGGEVLVVLYDDQMPEPFAVGEDAPRAPIAAAFLLSSRDDVPRYRLERTRSSSAAPAPHWGEIRSLVDFLQQRAARLVLRSDRVEWVWTAL